MKYFFKNLLCVVGILTIHYTYADYFYYNKISNGSPEKFVKNSSTYFNKADSETGRLYVLFYTARSYYKLKEDEKAVSNLSALEKRLEKNPDPVERANFYGKLAYLYTYLDYVWKSKAMLEKSDRCSLGLSDKSDELEAKTYFFYYKALVFSVTNNNSEAEHYYKLANQYYISLSRIDPGANPFLGHEISANLGNVYLNEKKLDSALSYSLLAIKRYHKKNHVGTVYLNIAEIYSLKKNTDSALFYYKKCIPELQAENNIEYLNAAFDSIKSIYIRKKDTGESLRYYHMQMAILKKLENMDNSSIETKTDSLLASNESTDSAKTILLFLVAPSLLLVSVLIFYFFTRIRKRNAGSREEQAEKNKTLNKREVQVETSKGYAEEEQPEPGSQESEPEVSGESPFQKKIIASLSAYEATGFYLDPTVTLAKVAMHLGTGTRSLSEIINQHKEMNFSAYINSLRVEYIIRLLYEDPKYRNYKIAYLATLCGFTSHSTFTKIFKSIKGISPSEYIDIIKANSEKTDLN